MLKDLSTQKSQYAAFVHQNYQKIAYGLGDYSSSYNENGMEERKLQLFLTETNYECIPNAKQYALQIYEERPMCSTGGACKVTIQNIYNKYTFTHHQVVPSTIWTITHNLGYIPGQPLITDENDLEIDGLITGDTSVSMIIEFSEPVAGYAYLT